MPEKVEAERHIIKFKNPGGESKHYVLVGFSREECNKMAKLLTSNPWFTEYEVV